MVIIEYLAPSLILNMKHIIFISNIAAIHLEHSNWTSCYIFPLCLCSRISSHLISCVIQFPFEIRFHAQLLSTDFHRIEYYHALASSSRIYSLNIYEQIYETSFSLQHRHVHMLHRCILRIFIQFFVQYI